MEIKAFRGLKNTTSPERFGGKGFLDAASNVDVDDSGRVLTREAAVLALAGAYHSLWAEDDLGFVGSGNDLYRVNADLSTTWLTRLVANRPIAFSRQQSTVYFSNGVDKGRIRDGQVLSWGIAPPTGQPVAQPSGGRLPAGRYQYALTFRRADGTESGTGVAGMIELAGTGGIAFSSIAASADPEVVDKCLYLSGPNGEELFRLAALANATTTHTYLGSGYDLTVRLETQFDEPPPPGDLLEVYNGVMYVVAGDVVWYSKPYQFENFCRRDRFMRFPGNTTMFAGVNDGVYVSAGEKTWFLAGKGPEDFKSQVMFDAGAITGTAAKTTIGALKGDEAMDGTPGGAAVMWASPDGMHIGLDGGTAINLTEREYSLPSAARGRGIVRQSRGYTQLLVALEGAQVAADNASEV